MVGRRRNEDGCDHPEKRTARSDVPVEWTWKGSYLMLEDGGSLADSFHADGSPKGFAQGARAPQETASLVLRYGNRSEFEAMCPGAQSSF
jgi:hypothetical protein